MQRIGIFGGTYNPPHLGHLQAAEEAVLALGLDRLLLMPNMQAPHKQLPAGSPGPEDRMAMLRLSVKDPCMEVSDLEIRRQGTSYTVDTVLALRQQYPDAELILLMGSDMFLSLDSWRQPRVIAQNASFGVLCRGMHREKAQILAKKAELESDGATVYLINNQVKNISSTQIRRLLVFQGASAFLPQKVEAFIRNHGFYGTDRDYKGVPAKELEQVVISLLKPNRVAHVLGCRDTAVELAKRWGADPVDAERAALLHDITKALDGHLQLDLCKAYGVELDDFSKAYPKTLHALTGSLVAERIFGENKAVVDAICCHTTGKADMNMLEKIIYVADYMEPNRDFPGVDELRYLTTVDMTKALIKGLEMTIAVLKKDGKDISPASQEALEFLGIFV